MIARNLVLSIFVYVSAYAGVPIEVFKKETISRIERVEAFKFLRSEAEKLGVRAWLFGGTAAAYAHYVKWDLIRESGLSDYHPDRFDYDYTNIYRSTQDLDVVVDGTQENARRLEQLLKEKFPHLQGSKTKWELRLLKSEHGDKEALLGNPDFANQHTDSHSTGMIEVTRGKGSEPKIRDLRDWENRTPPFLEDVLSGSLHYYFSDRHTSTKRFRLGLNPPIMSVVRYLTKAFQFGLKVREDDLHKIKQIIDDFSPEKDLETTYSKEWLIKNGKKLFLNAVDVNYAWNMLEELGLRTKLMKLDDSKTQQSLAWWMNKEPLRPKPLGSSGRTAREMGISVVAHETKDFLAYEAITRSHQGTPNLFISRNRVDGESATYGDGFYTGDGRSGMRGTGFTIRFNVDPNAREGVDFEIKEMNNRKMVIFKNRNAIRIIPESPNLRPLDFLKVVADFDEHDRGILEKLRRRTSIQMRGLTSNERSELVGFLDEVTTSYSKEKRRVVFQEFFKFEESKEYYRWLVEKSTKANVKEGMIDALSCAFENAHWIQYEHSIAIVKQFLSSHDDASLPANAAHILRNELWPRRNGSSELLTELRRKMMKSTEGDQEFVKSVLSRSDWLTTSNGLNVFRELSKTGGADLEWAKFILPRVLVQPPLLSREQSLEFKVGLKEWIRNIVARGQVDDEIIRSIALGFLQPKKQSLDSDFVFETIEKLAERKKNHKKIIVDFFAKKANSKVDLSAEPRAWSIIRGILKVGSADLEIAKELLSNSDWMDSHFGRETLEVLIKRGKPSVLRAIAQSVLNEPELARKKWYVEAFRSLVDSRKADREILKYIVSPMPMGWRLKAEEATLINELLQRGGVDAEVLDLLESRHAFNSPAWFRRPGVSALLLEFIKKAKVSVVRGFVRHVFVADYWLKHPKFIEIRSALEARGLRDTISRTCGAAYMRMKKN